MIRLTDNFVIKKEHTALVIIDLQKGITSRPTAPHDSKTVISNAAKLADAFRKNNMPVVLVHVAGTDADRLRPIADEQWSMPAGGQSDWSELVPELNAQASDIIITKKQWGAFYGTELDLQLRRRKIDTIVLCGISTNVGVESTARFAYEYGYQQVFAEDATSSMSAQLHTNTITSVFRRIGRVRSTEEILRAIE